MGCARRVYPEFYTPGIYLMTTQDIVTIAVLLTLVILATVFPGGPGTPRRFRRFTLARAENWSA